MQGQLWYAIGEKPHGPVSADVLQRLLLEGKITRSTLVWKEGEPEWLPLSELQGLEQVAGSIPPVLPQITPREKLVALPFAGPWRRFLARIMDLWVIGLPASVIASFALSRAFPEFGFWLQHPGAEYVFGWLFTPVVFIAEAGIYGIFGNTPGKALLRISVTTTDAVRLSSGQYLRRQPGVYWSGLGTGFPLVSLFTMIYQYRKVKSGGQATYDKGAFHVKAPRLGIIRGLLVTVVIILLLIAIGLVQNLPKNEYPSSYSGTTWMNQITGKPVSIPEGWSLSEDRNDDQQPIHIFTTPDYKTYVIFAREGLDPDLSLSAYASLWQTSVVDRMIFQQPPLPVTLEGREALVLTGTLVSDQTEEVRATLMKTGNQVWRVVILSRDGKEPISESVMKFQDLLFQSLN
ncbi:MAG: RDD family protein [Parvibaculaceae bacterium]|nr:RDD family protein [Parvibaculaceae bacterium]